VTAKIISMNKYYTCAL